MGGGAAPRYAPEDPTLPKPWRGLVDGSTGYLYYWNPETNVTQYERPLEEQLPPPPPPLLPPPPPRPPPKSASVVLASSSSAAAAAAAALHHHPDRDHDRHRHSSHSRSIQAGGSKGGNASADNHGHGVNPNPSRDAKPAASAEAYRRQHEIIVTGDNVPAPFATFESTNFSSEILKEVRYLLQGGAKCRTLRSIVPPSSFGRMAYPWWSAHNGGAVLGRVPWVPAGG